MNASNKKTKTNTTVPIESDKEQLISELGETINRINELYSKVKKILNV